MKIQEAIETMCKRCTNYEMCNGTGCEPKKTIEKLADRDKAMPVKEIHVDEYYCPVCGAENICYQGCVEDKFCSVCGQRLEVAE